MIINDNTETFKLDEGGGLKKPSLQKFFLPVVFILACTMSFGLGRLTILENNTPIRIEYDEELANDKLPSTASAINTLNTATPAAISNTTVVASSKSDKYHYLYCPGAKQIAEKNKIVFTSPAQAESAGFTLAANCSAR